MAEQKKASMMPDKHGARRGHFPVGRRANKTGPLTLRDRNISGNAKRYAREHPKAMAAMAAGAGFAAGLALSGIIQRSRA